MDIWIENHLLRFPFRILVLVLFLLSYGLIVDVDRSHCIRTQSLLCQSLLLYWQSVNCVFTTSITFVHIFYSKNCVPKVIAGSKHIIIDYVLYWGWCFTTQRTYIISLTCIYIMVNFLSLIIIFFSKLSLLWHPIRMRPVPRCTIIFFHVLTVSVNQTWFFSTCKTREKDIIILQQKKIRVQHVYYMNSKVKNAHTHCSSFSIFWQTHTHIHKLFGKWKTYLPAAALPNTFFSLPRLFYFASLNDDNGDYYFGEIKDSRSRRVAHRAKSIGELGWEL